MGPWRAVATLFVTFLLNGASFFWLSGVSCLSIFEAWGALGHHLGVNLVTFGDCLATLCSNWAQLPKHVSKGPFSGPKTSPKGLHFGHRFATVGVLLRSFSQVSLFIDFLSVLEAQGAQHRKYLRWPTCLKHCV